MNHQWRKEDYGRNLDKRDHCYTTFLWNHRETAQAKAVWRRLHILNGISKPGDVEDKDCLKGDIVFQWSHVVPYSELYIIDLIIWMRENGVVDCDHAIAKRWKQGYFNIAPTIPWMGSTMEYHIGGYLLAPTKKCLWRLCVFAQMSLYKAAVYEKSSGFKGLSISLLTSEWASANLTEQGFLKAFNGKAVYMGQKYAKEYLDDYEQDELAMTDVKGTKQVLIVSVIDRPLQIIILNQHFFSV